MRAVYIVGLGQVPVSKGDNVLARHYGAKALQAALADAALDRVDALYVGNMMSGILSNQQQLGALLADAAGLRGIEAISAEAACASGAAAMRLGVMAVASGYCDSVIACGVERMTHTSREVTTSALATASDWTVEGGCGESFISLNAKLMAAYMEARGVGAADFAPFSLVAHHNACGNPNAFFHKRVDLATYLASKEIVPPVRLFDASPVCDGAAAVVLVGPELAAEAASAGRPVVRVRASAVATDSLALTGRASLLRLDGAIASSRRAYDQAGVGPEDIQLFELHDAYTIISALSLEACGFTPPGTACRFAAEGHIAPGGRLPIATRGGLKGRGHPVGATGIYQIVEACQQLTGRAGDNQIPGVEVAMTQNIGGTGATVVTHILAREA